MRKHMQLSQREKERERAGAWQPLPWPHSSVSCSDADVLATSLTSTNGSCPRAAVQPACRSASPDCSAGTRKPTGTESTHTHTLGHMYVHIQYTPVCTNTHTHTHTGGDVPVLKQESTSAQTPSIALHSAPAHLTQSPCSRPEINR